MSNDVLSFSNREKGQIHTILKFIKIPIEETGVQLGFKKSDWPTPYLIDILQN